MNKVGIHLSAGFNLSTGPLFKISLLQLHEEEHILMINLHAAIADSQSLNVFAHDFIRVYSAKVNGLQSEPRAIGLQYADYADWQRRSVDSEVYRKQLQSGQNVSPTCPSC